MVVTRSTARGKELTSRTASQKVDRYANYATETRLHNTDPVTVPVFLLLATGLYQLNRR